METSSSNRSTFLLAKFSIHLALFVVFLVFFGIPSWKRCFYSTELYVFWTIRTISLWTYHFSKWPRYNAKGVLTKTEQTSMENLKLPAVTICPRFSNQYTSTMTPCQMLEAGAETLPGGEKATQAQSFGTLCSISAGGSYQITGSYQYQHQCRWISIKHLINNKINNIISRASVKAWRIWIVRACQYWFNSHGKELNPHILQFCEKGGVSSPERCIRTGRDGYNTLSILTFLYQQHFHHSIITTCITIAWPTLNWLGNLTGNGKGKRQLNVLRQALNIDFPLSASFKYVNICQ